MVALTLAFLSVFGTKRWTSKCFAAEWERRVIYSDGDNDAAQRIIVGLTSITNHRRDRIRLVSLLIRG